VGKRSKPVLQERFIWYPVRSAPSPNRSARFRSWPAGRRSSVGHWAVQTLSQKAGQNRLTPTGATRSGYRLAEKRLEILLVGHFERGKFPFARKVAQGLNPLNRKRLLKSLEPLRVTKCPFANLPVNRTGHWGEGVTAEEMGDICWVRPEIVATIKFAEWT
jgi:hypothetical protein